jgi:hypothetical protein
MILSGYKTEEYREIKNSIVSLLFNWKKVGNTRDYVTATFQANCNDREVNRCWNTQKEFSSIVFSNGYSSDRRQLEVEFYGLIDIREGKEEWGAVKGEKYFVIEFGNIISKTNC